MAKLKIPAQLRNETEGKDQVEISGKNVGEVLKNFITRYPALQNRIYDENGKVRRYVNIYLGDEDIRFMENLETPVNDATELSLIPAIAGGN